ncbi:partial Polyamine aminopropyltransferase, partial [Patescibacteria group bacterium]
MIREFLNIFYGNELCLGIVFGAWFLGIAIGAFVGAKIEHTFQHVFSVFIITLFIMCLVLPVQIFSVRCVRDFLSVGIGEYISLLPLFLTSIGLIFPFSFIVGFIFPFSSKVVWNVTIGQYSRNRIPPPSSPPSQGGGRYCAKKDCLLPGNTRDAAVDIGVVYIVESIGSLVGGLVFSFFLVSRFHPFTIITLLNSGMFILLTILLFPFLKREQVCFGKEEDKKTKGILWFVSLGLMLLTMVVLFSPIPDKVEALSTRMRWNTLNPRIELVTSADSRYQHIDIGRQAEQYSIYLNGQYAAAFPNEYEYAQIAHLVMTQHPSPKHVLLIGNGLGGIISEMLLYPIETLDYVELDQRLLQISGEYLSPSDKQALSDKRVTVFHQDGRYYVKNTTKKQHYDIILVNTPDPSTAFLNRFYTLEFFKEIQTILKSDGVLASSVSSAVTYIGKEVGSYTGSFYRTLHEAFLHVLVTPGQTNFYFACSEKGVITPDMETLMERYRKFQVKSDYFTEYLFYTLLQPEQVTFIEKQLSERKDLLVNTDARPVTYFLNLILWDSLAGGRLHGLFHGLKDVDLKSFLIPIMVALAGRIVYVILRQSKPGKKDDKHWAISQCQAKNRYSSPNEGDDLKITTPSSPPCEGGDKGEVIKSNATQPHSNQSESVEGFNLYYIRQLKTNCLIALATTGFTGIALEIVLLYAFQNVYGYIYERMGVIVAVFMVGLAVGGYIANRIILKIDGSTRPLSAKDDMLIPENCETKGWYGFRRERSVGRQTRLSVSDSRWITMLMIFEGIVAFYALIQPFLIHIVSYYSAAAEVGLVFFIGIAGILTGLEFPLVNKILIQTDRDIAISAGATDGADHIGAFSGALLAG